MKFCINALNVAKRIQSLQTIANSINELNITGVSTVGDLFVDGKATIDSDESTGGGLSINPVTYDGPQFASLQVGYPLDYNTQEPLGIGTTAVVDNASVADITLIDGGSVGIGTNLPLGDRVHVQGKEFLMRSPGGTNQFYVFGTNANENDTGVSIYDKDGTQTVSIKTSGQPRIEAGINLGSGQGSVGYTGTLIAASSASAQVYDGSSSATWGPKINISNEAATGSRTGAALVFAHRDSSSGVAAIVSTNAATDRADLRFITRGAGNAISERMQLTRDGLLGIDMLDGTSYAASGTGATKGLHIKTNGVPFIRYTETNSSGGTADFEIYVANGGYTLYDLDVDIKIIRT